MSKLIAYLVAEIVLIPLAIYLLPRLAPKKYISDRALDVAVGAMLGFGLYIFVCTLITLFATYW